MTNSNNTTLNTFAHFNLRSYTNSYLAFNPQTKEALIVDPFCFDEKLFTTIESLDLNITTVLLTSSHPAHAKGVKTIQKIYDIEVYQGGLNEEKQSGTFISEDSSFTLFGTEVKALTMEGSNKNGLVYIIGNNIFTGLVLEAGTICQTTTPYRRALLTKTIKQKLFSLKGDYTILPAYGPISTLHIEKEYNKL